MSLADLVTALQTDAGKAAIITAEFCRQVRALAANRNKLAKLGLAGIVAKVSVDDALAYRRVLVAFRFLADEFDRIANDGQASIAIMLEQAEACSLEMALVSQQVARSLLLSPRRPRSSVEFLASLFARNRLTSAAVAAMPPGSRAVLREMVLAYCVSRDPAQFTRVQALFHYTADEVADAFDSAVLRYPLAPDAGTIFSAMLAPSRAQGRLITAFAEALQRASTLAASEPAAGGPAASEPAASEPAASEPAASSSAR